jgi:xanthine dehydrogenase accessory factor
MSALPFARPWALPFPRTAAADEVLREASAALSSGRAVIVATVIARSGSAPSTPGQKLALFASSGSSGALEAVGTVGGGAVERTVIAAMVAALEDPSAQPKMEQFRLGPNLGMCCGGSATILVEPLRPSIAVLVVGAGHVGTETAPLLARLGFRVTLVDARDEAAGEGRGAPLPSEGTGALRVLHAEHDDPEVLAALGAPPERAFALVMTHDHQLDQAVIGWAREKGFAFVGGVGSRAKATRTRDRLRARGVAEPDVARVHMPVGVDIGARRPAEIAVAIAAQLVEVRASLEGLVRKTSMASAAE